MIEKVIADEIVYLDSHCIDNFNYSSRNKELDTLKLRKLLNELGFNPVSFGTQYIIEQLKYFFENDITELNSLKDSYSISAVKHNISIKNVQWDIESAVFNMNRYAKKETLENIFYWYDNKYNITPRYFLSTMIIYLNNNYLTYKK